MIKYTIEKIKTIIVDDHSSDKNLNRIKELTNNNSIEIISLDHEKYEKKIEKQKTRETFSNLASLLQCFEIGKNICQIMVISNIYGTIGSFATHESIDYNKDNLIVIGNQDKYVAVNRKNYLK